MRIMNNIQAQFAARQLNNTNFKLNKSLEKLSSGYRINHASDDAAGLAISEKFRTQIYGLDQARKNTQDGISLIQTAEAGMEEVHTMLQRMRVLAIQASNGTLTSSDRQLIQVEVTQLLSEIDRMSTTVTFNTMQLLNPDNNTNGSAALKAGSISIHVGAGSAETLDISLTSMTTTGLKINSLLSSTDQFTITTTTKAESAISLLTNAINTVSSKRAELGAAQNRLEHTYNFQGISRENQMAAESRIRDVDFAEEMIGFTKYQILAQAGNAMLAQANLKPQMVLQLFA